MDLGLAGLSAKEIENILRDMPPERKAELARMAEQATVGLRWVPTPGPQMRAYYSKADQLLFGGSSGGGKALALTTEIPTPDGWTTMGEIKVGDRVFDDRGEVCTVVAATPVMIGRPCHRVAFSDGSEIVSDAEHLWVTMTSSERIAAKMRTKEWRVNRRSKRKPEKIRKSRPARPDLAEMNRNRERNCLEPSTGSIRTTREIADSIRLRTGHLNHSIPTCGPIRLKTDDLPIDPYILGLWLGDGSSYKGEICTADREMLNSIEAAGYEHTKRGKYSYGVYGLASQVMAVGLLANKHIPRQYLRAGIEQRIALLQGLLDTDGYADPRGQIEFCVTNERLAIDAHELICTLGIKANMQVSPAALRGREVGTRYRIKFTAPFPAFRLPRKLERQKLSGLRPTRARHYIESVVQVDSVPVRCIQVDSPSRQYLVGRTFIPTHNSDLLCGLAVQDHDRSLLLRRINKDVSYIEDRITQILGSNTGYNGRDQAFYLPDGKVIDLGGLQHPGDEQRFKGRPHSLIGLDEASDFLEDQVQFVLGWLRSSTPGQRLRVVFATNPPTTSDGLWIIEWFAPWVDDKHPLYPWPDGELLWTARNSRDEWVWFKSPDPVEIDGRIVVPISRTFIKSMLSDNPYLAGTGYERQLSALPAELRLRYERGIFTTEAKDHEMQVIPTEWIDAAMKRWTRDGGKDRSMTHLGVDVSGGSKDQTVIARRHDLWFDQMIVKEGVDCKDGPAVAGQIMAAMRDGAIINIDTTGGWGNSAYDHLKNQVKQISLNGIVFSGKSSATSRDGKMRFANKRVEMYWRFREALDPSYGVPISLPDDNRLKADLAAARWEPRPGGYIAIEDKDEIRRRLGRSPDRGDAVVIAWNCNKSVSYAGRSEASNGYSVSDGSSRTPGLATRTANLGYSTFKSSRHRRR